MPQTAHHSHADATSSSAIAHNFTPSGISRPAAPMDMEGITANQFDSGSLAQMKTEGYTTGTRFSLPAGYGTASVSAPVEIKPFQLKHHNIGLPNNINPVVQRVIVLPPGSVPDNRIGGIKVKRLKERIVAYNLMCAHAATNNLIAELMDISDNIHRYRDEMTSKEKEAQEDTLRLFNNKVSAEIRRLEATLTPGINIANSVVTLTVPNGRNNTTRNFDFSLARHWFRTLRSEGKDLNSVMHASLGEGAIEADCLYIGKQIQLLWNSGAPEPGDLTLTTPAGRRYRVDKEGSSDVLNHFFVISGTAVSNVTADEYRFIREISKIVGNAGDERQAVAYWKLIKSSWLSRIPAMNLITNYDITQVNGILSLEQEREQEMDQVHEDRFKSDIRRFMQANGIPAMPSNFLTQGVWVTVSSMDYDRASNAYKRLFAKHKLHFRDALNQELGKKELYKIDD